MKIVVARVDNRLLHGIVSTQWVPMYSVQRIMVIDDAVADNFLTKESMKLGKPAGIALSIISLNFALEAFAKDRYQNQNIFLLVKNPEIILKLIENGIPVDSVNVGITTQREETTKISKRVYLNNKEIQMYLELLKKKLDIFIQYVPCEKRISMASAMKKAGIRMEEIG